MNDATSRHMPRGAWVRWPPHVRIAMNGSILSRQVTTRLDIVAIIIDQECAIERRPAYSRGAVVLGAMRKAYPMEIVNRPLRRGFEAQVNRARSRNRVARPEAWSAGGDDEKWRRRRSVGNDHPTLAITGSMLLDDSEAKRFQHARVEPGAPLEILDDDAEVIEHFFPDGLVGPIAGRIAPPC
jgi:hypothetical protein